MAGLMAMEVLAIAPSFVNLDVVAAQCRYWGSIARLGYAEALEISRFSWDPLARDHDARPEMSVTVEKMTSGERLVTSATLARPFVRLS